MVKVRRTLLVGLILSALCGLPAGAEIYTVKMENQSEFITRYQPRQSARDESRISLLTEFGNWISLSKSEIVEINSETETRGFGTVLDTSTIDIGWAPNDKPEAAGAASDPTTQLLNYLTERDAAGEQDFSVQQFVTTEGAGQGGLPASGVTSSGSSSFPVAIGGTAAAEPSSVDQ